MNEKLRCPNSGHPKGLSMHFRESFKLDLPKKENQSNTLKGLLTHFGEQKYFTVEFSAMSFPRFWGKHISLQSEKP